MCDGGDAGVWHTSNCVMCHTRAIVSCHVRVLSFGVHLVGSLSHQFTLPSQTLWHLVACLTFAVCNTFEVCNTCVACIIICDARVETLIWASVTWRVWASVTWRVWMQGTSVTWLIWMQGTSVTWLVPSIHVIWASVTSWVPSFHIIPFIWFHSYVFQGF